MNAPFTNLSQGTEAQSFDLFRLSKSKRTVDVSPNTLRGYCRQGLKFYRQGKAVFISKQELAGFIRGGAL
jgi:hypothetical protein